MIHIAAHRVSRQIVPAIANRGKARLWGEKKRHFGVEFGEVLSPASRNRLQSFFCDLSLLCWVVWMVLRGIMCPCGVMLADILSKVVLCCRIFVYLGLAVSLRWNRTFLLAMSVHCFVFFKGALVMKRVGFQPKGFTLVELLVVIAIIGV
ncbi:MAG: type IV pilin protein, partial [Rhodopirellula sp. JB055]|uniref:type IV pilin protein n=1 Tax=Rhodopirellula sp. JB055 TaxID=3342846 RepID=UPI00370A73E4